MELATRHLHHSILSLNDLWSGQETERDTPMQVVIQHKFMASQEGEVITAEKNMLLKDVSHLTVADKIAELTGNIRPLSGHDDKSYVVLGEVHSHPILAFVTQGTRSRHSPATYLEDDDEACIIGIKVNRVKIEITAHRDAIRYIVNQLTTAFKEAKVSSIRWWFNSSHGTENREMFLEPVTTTLHPEFYPDMKIDNVKVSPTDYIESYLKSDATILMLAGATGSGKTTLLRHLICDFNLIADIIYDETLMKKDNVFQDFMFSRSQIMIIEDADSIVFPRVTNNDPIMARLLNVSDGIIKLPEKKIVFTTNMTEFDKVDAALTRPGRCFDTLHTRTLTYEESCAAARAAGLAEPTVDKNYSLAELFSNRTHAPQLKIGFR